MKYPFFFIVILLLFPVNVKADDNTSELYLGTQTNLSNSNLKSYYNFFSTKHLKQKRMKIPNSIILGYEKNSYLSFELNVDNINIDKNYRLNQFENIELNSSIKLSYPIFNKLFIYHSIGSKIQPYLFFKKLPLKQIMKSTAKLVETFSIGFERMFKNHVLYRFGYELEMNSTDIKYNNKLAFKHGKFNMSFFFPLVPLHYFNKSNSFIMNTTTHIKETILFPFGSSKLTSAAHLILEKLNEKIKKMNFSYVIYNITGYSDKFGIKSKQEKISVDRMKSISNYLTFRGIAKKYIKEKTIEESSIASKFCKNINNKSLLISCLAPDRRVEIDVEGIN
ncbi:Outer membrane protein A [Buchnera aphidicola (Eriosoma lanigerum)]|uniref:OmpA family protein n=1 Tax=Buchnera aphidicola TaxID=9 RepID=UPI00346474B1